MLAEQDGRCVICMKAARTRRLAVDHDHATQAVRGLLCYRCNQYLGQWENDPIAVHNLILYLWNIAEAHGLVPAPLEVPAPTLVPGDS